MNILSVLDSYQIGFFEVPILQEFLSLLDLILIQEHLSLHLLECPDTILYLKPI